jgi:hypothetical protein
MDKHLPQSPFTGQNILDDDILLWFVCLAGRATLCVFSTIGWSETLKRSYWLQRGESLQCHALLLCIRA